jgi:acyl carrier protein
MAVDWQRYFRYRGTRPAFLLDIDAALAAPGAPGERSVLELLHDAPVERRRAVLLEHVRQQTLSVLGVPAGRTIDNDQGLRDAGLDSLMALELKNRLQASLGRPLPATLAFDFPTIDALTQYLADEVLRLAAPQVQASPPVEKMPPIVDLSDLTEEEAAAMLAEELAALQRDRAGLSKRGRGYTHG